MPRHRYVPASCHAEERVDELVVAAEGSDVRVVRGVQGHREGVGDDKVQRNLWPAQRRGRSGNGGVHNSAQFGLEIGLGAARRTEVARQGNDDEDHVESNEAANNELHVGWKLQQVPREQVVRVR